MFQRVHGLPIFADFEMQFDQIGIGTSHLPNFLPFYYCLTLLHQYLVIVSISAEIRIVMLNDDQLPIAP